MASTDDSFDRGFPIRKSRGRGLSSNRSRTPSIGQNGPSRPRSVGRGTCSQGQHGSPGRESAGQRDLNPRQRLDFNQTQSSIEEETRAESANHSAIYNTPTAPLTTVLNTSGQGRSPTQFTDNFVDEYLQASLEEREIFVQAVIEPLKKLTDGQNSMSFADDEQIPSAQQIQPSLRMQGSTLSQQQETDGLMDSGSTSAGMVNVLRNMEQETQRLLATLQDTIGGRNQTKLQLQQHRRKIDIVFPGLNDLINNYAKLRGYKEFPLKDDEYRTCLVDVMRAKMHPNYMLDLVEEGLRMGEYLDGFLSWPFYANQGKVWLEKITEHARGYNLPAPTSLRTWAIAESSYFNTLFEEVALEAEEVNQSNPRGIGREMKSNMVNNMQRFMVLTKQLRNYYENLASGQSKDTANMKIPETSDLGGRQANSQPLSSYLSNEAPTNQ